MKTDIKIRLHNLKTAVNNIWAAINVIRQSADNLTDEPEHVKESAMPRWVSVDERLPEDWQYVICYPPYSSRAFEDEPRHVVLWNASYEAFQYYLGGSVHHARGITHWQPLPPAPEIEE